MAILCGTDFSAPAAQAADVAAAVSRRLGQPLRLAHVVPTAADEAQRQRARDALARESERLRASGAEVREDLLSGPAEEALARHAESIGARALLVAALGEQTSAARWLLGGSAERIVVCSKVPVLVVRDGSTLSAWARGERRLRVAIGVDYSPPSEAAVAFAGDLRRIGPCDLILLHVCWAPAEHQRLRIEGPLDLVAVHPEVESTVLRDLQARYGALPGEGECRILVRSGLGRPADHLTILAEQEKADLLVVGTHQRTGLSKLWHGSVSNDVLRFSKIPVACVPALPSHPSTPVPEIRGVLVTSDLSPLGNRAIPYAYALLGKGGAVHVLHVSDEEEDGKPAAQMRELIPDSATARGIETHVHVVAGTNVPLTICQQAERLGVDVVCIASHGRSGLSMALLGSVAQALIGMSRRPVFVVRIVE